MKPEPSINTTCPALLTGAASLMALRGGSAASVGGFGAGALGEHETAVAVAAFDPAFWADL